MAAVDSGGGAADLERSCARRGDWMRLAPSQPGIDRMEAFFAGHAYDPHRHDTYALGITLSGVQRFDYRGSRADSLAGNAIALHPDEPHDGRAGIEAGFRYRMLYVAPGLIRAALGDRAVALPFVRAGVTADARLRRAIGRALADLDRVLEPLDRDEIVLGLAEALLALDPGAARERSGGAGCSIAVARARAFLDAEFARSISSEELEGITGLSRYALARQFRAGLGTSPYRYLTMRRLDRARRLMRSGLPIAEAAIESGFADQSHMTRRFRSAYGLPPGRWLAMQRGMGLGEEDASPLSMTPSD